MTADHWDQATNLYRSLIERAPAWPEALLAYANFLLYSKGPHSQKYLDSTTSLAIYQEAQDQTDSLLRLAPDHSKYQREASASYERLGDLHLRLGDTKTALQFFQQALDSRIQLVALDPKDSQFQRGLFVSYYKMSTLYRADGLLDAALALDYLRKAHQQLLDMQKKGILAPDDERFISRLADEITTLENTE